METVTNKYYNISAVKFKPKDLRFVKGSKEISC